MLRLLADNDINHKLLRGLQRRLPKIDLITARSVGLSHAPDPELLEWATQAERIIITHDQRTMPGHVRDRIAAGGRVSGVIIISRKLPIRRVIDDLELIVTCGDEDDWENPILRIP